MTIFGSTNLTEPEECKSNVHPGCKFESSYGEDDQYGDGSGVRGDVTQSAEKEETQPDKH